MFSSFLRVAGHSFSVILLVFLANNSKYCKVRDSLDCGRPIVFVALPKFTNEIRANRVEIAGNVIHLDAFISLDIGFVCKQVQIPDCQCPNSHCHLLLRTAQREERYLYGEKPRMNISVLLRIFIFFLAYSLLGLFLSHKIDRCHSLAMLHLDLDSELLQSQLCTFALEVYWLREELDQLLLHLRSR